MGLPGPAAHRPPLATALAAGADGDSPLYARRSGGARRVGDFEPVGKRELMAPFDDWGDGSPHLDGELSAIALAYELKDRVRFAAETFACGSGFPVIEVQGRSDDVLALPGVAVS